MSASRFPKSIADAIRDAKILGIRAGTKPHRIIGIWAVVVERRVFVRSYTLKPRSWWRTFREDPRGIIEVNGKRIKVRPVFYAQRTSKETRRSSLCREVSHAGLARVRRVLQRKEAERYDDRTCASLIVADEGSHSPWS